MPQISNSTSKFYNIIYRFYPVIDWLFMPSKKGLIKYINSLDGNPNVLDIGMGYAHWWRHCIRAQFTGIDTASKMVDHVRKEFPEAKLSIGPAEKLPFSDNSFDVVVLAHVLSVINDPQIALSEALRVTVNGGTVIIINHDSTGWEWIDIPLGYLSKWVGVNLPFYLGNMLSRIKSINSQLKIGKFNYFLFTTMQIKK